MKIILLLFAVVALGWLLAALVIVALIFFVSLAAWAVMTFQSARRDQRERAERSPVKRFVEQAPRRQIE